MTHRCEILNLKSGSVKLELDSMIMVFKAAAQVQDTARCEVLRAQCQSLLDAHLDLVQETVDVILIAHGLK